MPGLSIRRWRRLVPRRFTTGGEAGNIVRPSSLQGEHGLAKAKDVNPVGLHADSASLSSKASKQYAGKQYHVGNSKRVESICRGDDRDFQACVVRQQREDGKHERNNKD